MVDTTCTNQASIEYLNRFFINSITSIRQKEHSFSDQQATVAFSFWADDYIDGKEINRYQVTVSKASWLPQRIERHNRLGMPIEVIIFKGFRAPDSGKDILFAANPCLVAMTYVISGEGAQCYNGKGRSCWMSIVCFKRCGKNRPYHRSAGG